ncbi:hypothetical protein GQ457_02G030540 [Hibiscus cannabinus]
MCTYITISRLMHHEVKRWNMVKIEIVCCTGSRINLNDTDWWFLAEKSFLEYSMAWNNTNQMTDSPSQLPSEGIPPKKGFMKVNYDASFVKEPRSAAIAAILRNSDGSIVGVMLLWFKFI